MPSRPTARNGFTLVELLVAMALASFLLAGGLSVFTYSNQTYTTEGEVVGAQQTVRSAMQIMTYEIRMAGYVPLAARSALGAYEQLEEATATAMTFLADPNSDGIPEKVRYALSGTTLTRESKEWNGTAFAAQTGVVTLAENITALNFQYTYADGTQGVPASSVDRGKVRAVTVTLVGRTEHPDPKYTAFDGTHYRYRTLTSEVRMRNMGL
jgi:type IV pilus assembly protein PilW